MSDENKIAIIGFSANVAGSCDADALFNMVSQNKTGLTQSNNEEQLANLPQSLINSEHFINIGGGPSDYQTFDAQFFGYSPKEAALLDPQIRKSLESAYHAVEHAGYAPSSLSSSTSCYIANSVNSYFTDNLRSRYEESDDAEKNQMLFLNEADFLSTRIAYHFNWRGAALTVKCGCSSSMVAIHEACKSLLQYDCDTALAGGVAIKSRYQYGYLYEKDGILSADGLCCPFSENATGTIFANGLGFVLLKRLEDAIADNDTIHAVILSSFTNNDGNDKVGYMAPSLSGQVKAMKTALAYADVTADQISYIEAHGTGTEIGDPIEYNGLRKVFSDCRPNSIALGSVKGNIGHIDAASGVAGLIKTIQDLKHQTISPNHNFKAINPKCDFNESPFICKTEKSTWEPVEGRRIAAISSFGIGGTNGQLIIEDYRSNNTHENLSENTVLITLSAKTKEALLAKVNAHKIWLENHEVILHDLAATLMIGREHFNYRVAYVVASPQALLSELSNFDETLITSCESGLEVELTSSLFAQPKLLKSHFLQGDHFTIKNQEITFKRLVLPCYPFAKNVHWIYPNDNKNEKIKDVSRWFYMPSWQRQELPIPKLSTWKQTVLFFDDQSSLSKHYQKQLQDLGANVISITTGKHFIQHDNNNYAISPESKEDYQSLIMMLNSLPVNINTIIHTWSLGQGEQSFNTSLSLGLYSLLYLIQTITEANDTLPNLVQIITDNSANISGDEIVKPLNATLQGMSQVLPKEYDELTCQLLDINTKGNPRLICNQLLAELARMESTELALRGKHRFIKTYQPTHLTDTHLNEISICANKNYLVIGGLGNFGMELSEFIGAQHQGNVFLTTRMQFPPKEEWPDWIKNKPLSAITQKIEQLFEIEKRGASINVLTADVCDINSLQQIKTDIENTHGPLSGVVHAAGVVDSGMISHKTIESLEQVFAAKIHGTKNICQIFLNHDLDFLILCSSMNSIIGGLGQLDNTAANAFIDAYAEHCLNQGYNNVIAINWGAVNEARARNYSVQPQFSKLSEEHVKNKMTKHEIFDVYRRLFSSNLGPRVVVSTIDFNQVIKNWSHVGSLKSLMGAVTQKKQQRNLDSNVQLPHSDMEIFIAELWQDYLGIDVIAQEDNFFDLGGNSLVAIQFIAKLTQHYPIKMHAMAIYEYPKLNKFAAYAKELLKEVKEKQALMT